MAYRLKACIQCWRLIIMEVLIIFPCICRYMKNAYLFTYYLIQFCGHSWIFTNMTVRFFSFGKGKNSSLFLFLTFNSCSYLILLNWFLNFCEFHLISYILNFDRIFLVIRIFAYCKSQSGGEGWKEKSLVEGTVCLANRPWQWGSAVAFLLLGSE